MAQKLKQTHKRLLRRLSSVWVLGSALISHVYNLIRNSRDDVRAAPLDSGGSKDSSGG